MFLQTYLTNAQGLQSLRGLLFGPQFPAPFLDVFYTNLSTVPIDT